MLWGAYGIACVACEDGKGVTGDGGVEKDGLGRKFPGVVVRL